MRRYCGRIRGGGTVLDVACGAGRHARYLARLGHAVTAVDIDVTRIASQPDSAALELVAADLEHGEWPFASRGFDGIVVVNYLYRPHFPILADSLRPGGVLLFDTFASGNERFGRPRNPAHLLQPGELLRAFGAALKIVAYEHGTMGAPRPAVRQRLLALRR